MKKLKLLLFVTLFATIIQTATAQLTNVGVHLSRIYGLESTVNNFGIHGTIDIRFFRKFGLTVNAGYFMPHKSNSEITLYALSSSTSPYRLDVPSTNTTSGVQTQVMAKLYFINGFKGQGLGFYGMAGVGVFGYFVKTTLAPYNVPLYGDFEHSSDATELGANFTLNTGVGLDWQSQYGSLFLEQVFCLPNTSEGDNSDIPVTIQLNLGYRFLIHK